MKFSEFHVGNLEIGEYTNKSIKLVDNLTNKPVKIQLPKMYMPFGISSFVPEVGETKWNIDFSMKGYNEEGNQVKLFYEFLKAVEDRVIDSVQEQSQAIFGKNMSRDVLLTMFNSNIKESSDREPKFRLKYDPKTTHVFDCDDTDITSAPVDRAYSQCSGVALAEIGNVYFLNKKFGIVWKMPQLKIFEPQRLKGFQFKDGYSWADDE